MTMALIGHGEALLGPPADVVLDVPSTSKPLVQHVRTCLYPYICVEVELGVAVG